VWSSAISLCKSRAKKLANIHKFYFTTSQMPVLPMRSMVWASHFSAVFLCWRLGTKASGWVSSRDKRSTCRRVLIWFSGGCWITSEQRGGCWVTSEKHGGCWVIEKQTGLLGSSTVEVCACLGPVPLTCAVPTHFCSPKNRWHVHGG
jgi:hypothetical protein